jgi:hypothetical protein
MDFSPVYTDRSENDPAIRRKSVAIFFAYFMASMVVKSSL